MKELSELLHNVSGFSLLFFSVAFDDSRTKFKKRNRKDMVETVHEHHCTNDADGEGEGIHCGRFDAG